MTFIVECSICSQPWEVPTIRVAGPGRYIQVPEHGMVRCTDQQVDIDLVPRRSGDGVRHRKSSGLGEP